MSSIAPHEQVAGMKVERPGAIDHDRARREMRVRARTFKPYDFEYEYTGGRVKALFIGINYNGSPTELSGCCNDVKTMLDMLKRVEFPIQEAAILVDDPSVASFVEPPTRGNMIRYMTWLTDGAKDGDVLFLHYSGHGAQTKARKDDEEAYDQCLVPLDYATDGCILDNDLFKALVEPLPLGARLTCVFDCCHSASMLDLPFKIASCDVAQADGHQYRMKQVRDNNFTLGDVIAFSGCADDGKSSDVKASSGAGGAATAAFTWCVENEHGADYLEVLVKTREALVDKGFTQVPQLSCSKPLDMNKPFSLFGDLTVDELQFQESAPNFFSVCSSHCFCQVDPNSIPPQFRHHLMEGYDPAAIQRRFSHGHAVIKSDGDPACPHSGPHCSPTADMPTDAPASALPPPSLLTSSSPPPSAAPAAASSPNTSPGHASHAHTAPHAPSMSGSGTRTKLAPRPVGRPPSGVSRRTSPTPTAHHDAELADVASAAASASAAPPLSLPTSCGPPVMHITAAVPRPPQTAPHPPAAPSAHLLSPTSPTSYGSSRPPSPGATQPSPLMTYINLTTLVQSDLPEPTPDSPQPSPAVSAAPARVPALKSTSRIAKPKLDGTVVGPSPLRRPTPRPARATTTTTEPQDVLSQTYSGHPSVTTPLAGAAMASSTPSSTAHARLQLPRLNAARPADDPSTTFAALSSTMPPAAPDKKAPVHSVESTTTATASPPRLPTFNARVRRQSSPKKTTPMMRPTATVTTRPALHTPAPSAVNTYAVPPLPVLNGARQPPAAATAPSPAKTVKKNRPSPSDTTASPTKVKAAPATVRKEAAKPATAPTTVSAMPNMSKNLFALDETWTMHKFLKSIYGQIELELGDVNVHLVIGTGLNGIEGWMTLKQLYDRCHDAEDGVLYVRYTVSPPTTDTVAAGRLKGSINLATRKRTAEKARSLKKVPVAVEALQPDS